MGCADSCRTSDHSFGQQDSLSLFFLFPSFSGLWCPIARMCGVPLPILLLFVEFVAQQKNAPINNSSKLRLKLKRQLLVMDHIQSRYVGFPGSKWPTFSPTTTIGRNRIETPFPTWSFIVLSSAESLEHHHAQTFLCCQHWFMRPDPPSRHLPGYGGIPGGSSETPRHCRCHLLTTSQRASLHFTVIYLPLLRLHLTPTAIVPSLFLYCRQSHS